MREATDAVIALSRISMVEASTVPSLEAYNAQVRN